MRFLAMTVLCVDIYKGIDKECVGGNALNIATQYIKSGADNVSVLGAIGKDRYGRLIRDYFLKSRIDTSHLHEIEGDTASNIIYIDKSGDRYFLPDSWNGGVYDTFRLSEDDWSFVNSHD
ncbi:MAG TPA: PfkB family carbohydrate kinase, partial [Clostridia bacterium]|nr:PfkB family carbohydrate kinase [Clostridia bacterium]